MELEWSHRNENNNLVDYFIHQSPNVLLRVATYNIKLDKLTVYNAKENNILHQNLLEHINKHIVKEEIK
jgi:hypothetical protein